MNIDWSKVVLPEELLHDAAEDGVLYRREHEPHVVRVSGDGDVGVDLCSGIVQYHIMTSWSE